MAKHIVAHRKRRTSFQTHDDHASGLSSEQIWNTLNGLLAIAARPIFDYTEFGVDLCLSLVAASMDKRRKVSIYSSDDYRAVLMHTLIFKSGGEILDVLQQTGVERNLIADPLLDAIAINELPGKLLADSPFSEEALLRHLRQAMQHYLLFRQQVSERFVKLATSLGKKNAWVKSQGGLVSDSEEHVNNYMLSVFRAIDKFYPHRGTLASYVTSWMNNAAGSTYSVFMGEAYVVPRSHRRSLVDESGEMFGNFSLPLEEAAEVVHDDNPSGDADYIRLFNSLYAIPALFPAMLQDDFPLTLRKNELETLLQADNIIDIPEDINKHVFNEHHASLVADNINFSYKPEKRRKK